MRLDTRNGIFLWIVLAEMQTVLATWSRYCTPFSRSIGPHPRGICGSNINDMLSLLCYNGYNRRRRDTAAHQNHILEREGILIPREAANSYLVKRSSYYEQGIVCECCYNRCSLRELRGYCRYEDPAPGRFGLFKRSVEDDFKSVLNRDRRAENTFVKNVIEHKKLVDKRNKSETGEKGTFEVRDQDISKMHIRSRHKRIDSVLGSDD